MQLTLWRDLTVPVPDHEGKNGEMVTVSCSEVSPAALANLYFEAYPPPQRPATIEEAAAEMEATAGGAYGLLIPNASLAVMSDGRPIAVVQTVLRAPWPDVQRGPFVIELFTAPAHRNRGLGRALMRRAIAATAVMGESWLGLRVDSDNTAAETLYRSLGFHEQEGVR